MAWSRPALGISLPQIRGSVCLSGESPLRPDPMPLREALRGLRYALRRGGETLSDTMPLDALPKPAADLAGAVLHEMGNLARGVDDVASGLAKSVLGGGGTSSATLHDMADGTGAETRFAIAVYSALGAVLHRLGAPETFVSEAAARKAYARIDRSHHRWWGDAGTAADLTVGLLEARVIRGVTATETARVPAAALEPVALFAVMLWLQSERSEDDNEAALDAATDLAVALVGEVTIASAARDTDRIEALYTKFAAHV